MAKPNLFPEIGLPAAIESIPDLALLIFGNETTAKVARLFGSNYNRDLPRRKGLVKTVSDRERRTISCVRVWG